METNSTSTTPIIDPLAVEATSAYCRVCSELTDRIFWPLKMFTTLNLFLWHIEAFKKDENPVSLFVDIFSKATRFLVEAAGSGFAVHPFLI